MFEKQAFEPYDETLDQESWPLLALTDAVVYKFRRNEKDVMCDLLDVQDTGPYRIKGKLSPIPTEFSNIVYPGRFASRIYTEPLVIFGVTTYSIQALEDGGFNLWALGKCAWYAITPAPEYAGIFAKSLEKMALWSFLQDRYIDQGYSGGGEPIEGAVADIYSDYSKACKKGVCPSAKAAEKMFDQYHRYLLFEMCALHADYKMWARTPLFRDWAVNYKREVEGIVKTTSNGSLEDRLAAGLAKQEVKEEDDEDDGPLSAPTKYPARAHPAKKAPAKKAPAKKTPAKKTPTPVPIKREPSPTLSHITVLDSDDEDSDDDQQPAARRSSTRTKTTRPIYSAKGKSVLRPIRTQAPPPPVDSSSDSEPEPPITTATKRTLPPSSYSFSATAANSDTKRACTTTSRSALSKPTTTLRVASPMASITTTTTKYISPLASIPTKRTGANRPGGVWECEIAGCRHFIVDADSAESLAAVEAHYEEHGRVMRKAMEAIGGEVLPTRPKHHVDNLLAKIEKMADLWARTKPAPLSSEENGF